MAFFCRECDFSLGTCWLLRTSVGAGELGWRYQLVVLLNKQYGILCSELTQETSQALVFLPEVSVSRTSFLFRFLLLPVKLRSCRRIFLPYEVSTKRLLCLEVTSPTRTTTVYCSLFSSCSFQWLRNQHWSSKILLKHPIIVKLLKGELYTRVENLSSELKEKTIQRAWRKEHF